MALEFQREIEDLQRISAERIKRVVGGCAIHFERLFVDPRDLVQQGIVLAFRQIRHPRGIGLAEAQAVDFEIRQAGQLVLNDGSEESYLTFLRSYLSAVSSRRLRNPVLTLLLLWLVGVNLRTVILGVPPTLPALHRSLSLSYTSAGLLTSLPVLLSAALLFLTPLSFLMSSARNSRALSDRLALALGLIISPLLVYLEVGLDLMWTGLVAGSAAYGAYRLRRTLK